MCPSYFYGYNMSSLTFEEFKSYFEFALEVVGLLGAIGTVLYKFDAIWRVS
jgi:hypothetical protein